MNGMRKKQWVELIIWTLILFVVIFSLNSCQPKVDPVEADHITVEIFWVSTCPYCFEQLAVVEEICHEMVGHPYLEGEVQFVAANIDLSAEELFAMLEEISVLPPFFKMTTGSHLPKWSNGLPTIVVKDTFGKTQFRYIGFADKTQLYSMIMETLGFTEVI